MTEDARAVTERPEAVRPGLVNFRFALAVLWTLVILTLCWIPRSVLEEVEPDAAWKIPNLDKVIHCGIFVAFAVLWLRVRPWPMRSLWVAIGGIVVAAVSELGQELPIVGRDATLGDLATDILGVLIGLAVARWIEPLLRSLESRLFRSPTS
jgi:hypothetical protein